MVLRDGDTRGAATAPQSCFENKSKNGGNVVNSPTTRRTIVASSTERSFTSLSFHMTPRIIQLTIHPMRPRVVFPSRAPTGFDHARAFSHAGIFSAVTVTSPVTARLIPPARIDAADDPFSTLRP